MYRHDWNLERYKTRDRLLDNNFLFDIIINNYNTNYLKIKIIY